MPSTSPLIDRYRAAVDALDAVVTEVSVYRSLTESDLLEAGRLAAEEKRIVDHHATLVAGEIARRSTRELGHSGLAQRNGFRNAVELVKATTGATARESVQAVRVGTLVQSAQPVADLVSGEIPEPAEPWLAPTIEALSAGTLSVGHVDAIRAGLGRPSADVSTEVLMTAVTRLTAEASRLDVDATLKRAYRLRDEIDAAGVADRERAAFEKRSLRHRTFPDGSGQAILDLDPENNAKFTALVHRATSPRFGGPRFVDAERAAQADRILNDPRTTPQLLLDVVMNLLDAGADADSSELLGSGAPSLVVLATEKTILERAGHGYIEGSDAAVSYETIERIACTGIVQILAFNDKLQPLNASPEARLYNRAKRRALAARDGGCPVEGCDCPPSMTEAHHIEQVARDDGKTTIENGLLLCRFHHLMLHNLHFEIGWIDGGIALIPPPAHVGAQRPLRIISKSPALAELARQSGYALVR